jgi:hypothetical protein
MMSVMYDEILLQERMAELGLNWYQLGKRAGVDAKTAKSIVLRGTGQPRTIDAIRKVLRVSRKRIVKRHHPEQHATPKRRSASR